MNGAQDLGGMMGFGPIEIEPNEPVFHAAWEKRALAITLAAGACRLWNLDANRHTRESLPPAAYLSKSYYDIWLSALEIMVQRTGMIGADELRSGEASVPPRPTPGKLLAADVPRALAAGSPCDRPATAPAAFAVGDQVRTKLIHPRTHTRLPRYARGKLGVIEAVRGCFVYPDSNAHGLGEDPRWVYTVLFTGRELWGEDADETSRVSIDAWEPYLERA